nr:crosslink repair DNA glycosylase YcaQ family protein [Cellulomonas sp. KH9]
MGRAAACVRPGRDGLGPPRPRARPATLPVYDRNGNAGPAVWVDGRVVGGWAQCTDGEVVTEVFEDVGNDAAATVAERAAALTALLGDVRLTVRARGWTPVETQLRA